MIAELFEISINYAFSHAPTPAYPPPPMILEDKKKSETFFLKALEKVIFH